jgi:hypothetical protein
MRYELKSISLWSVIRVSFFLNMVIGFVLGALYALMMSIYFAAASSFPALIGGGIDISGSSIGAILILFPLIGAACGAVFHTILAMIICLAYNLIGRMTGGFEFELNRADPESRPSESIVSHKTEPVKISSTRSMPPADNPPPPPPFASGSTRPREQQPDNSPPISPRPNNPDPNDRNDYSNL